RCHGMKRHHFLFLAVLVALGSTARNSSADGLYNGHSVVTHPLLQDRATGVNQKWVRCSEHPPPRLRPECDFPPGGALDNRMKRVAFLLLASVALEPSTWATEKITP